MKLCVAFLLLLGEISWALPAKDPGTRLMLPWPICPLPLILCM